MTCASTNTIAALIAGAADPATAARLEAHLDQCRACRRLVAELGRGLSAIDRAAPREQLPRIGETIGRYEIRRVVGVGGMGVVYEAHDATLDRVVAVKLLRPDLLEGPSLLAEAQAMARLQHPNIVTVHDAGIANGQLYVCMEYVAGSTLRARVATCKHDWRAITALYLAAGEGLAYVHRAQLVHLDFKPDNVLVDRDGRRVRVTDFGLARMIGTAEARIVGTPAYMAPEQRARGTVDARADQYAFCASLAEALANANPPARLRRAIDRGLSHAPDDRFADMTALLAAIAAGLERRRRPPAGVAIVASAMAVAAFAVTLPRPTHVVTTTVDAPRTLWRERLVTRSAPPAASPAAIAAQAAPPGITQTPPPSPYRVQAARGFEPRRTPVLHVAPVELPFVLAAALDEAAEPAGTDDDREASTLFPPTCNDGSPLLCAQDPPACTGRQMTAIRNGCWACLDPLTCYSHTAEPSAPSPVKRKPPRPKPAPPGGGGGGSGSGSGSQASEPTCGNGFCEIGEDHASCASDCCETDASGSCLAVCGNGFCEAGEDHGSCAADCCETTSSGACVPVCGNGFCETGETAASCPGECP